MSYRHYHNFSFHTHHRRSKGGHHHRAVCRQQRPWRVGIGLALIAAAVLVALNMGALDPAVAAVRDMVPEETEIDLPAHEQAIVEVINAERFSRGLGTLEWDPDLQAIARAHSRDMAQGDYFEHVNGQGKDYRERAWDAGYACLNPWWKGVAENLYFGVRGHQRAEDPVTNWLESPGHRRAMLDPTFSKAAIGIHEGTLSGYGHGQFTTLLLC